MTSSAGQFELRDAERVAMPAVLPQPAHPHVSAPARVTVAAASRRRWGTALVIVVLAIYALLQNGYFVPNSDGEYYISIARNLLAGKGYVYNGEPVGLVPPGWPVVLAGALWVSDSFSVVNWLPALLLLGSVAVWFCVLTRLTTPRRAFVTMLCSATLFWGYHSAILLQSEALFCLLLSLMMLLAFQIAEGKPAAWRIAALVPLGAALVLVRWVGLTAWVVPAAVLLSGTVRTTAKARWLAVILLAVTAVGTLVAMRHALTTLGANSVAADFADAPPPAGPRSTLLDQRIVVPNVDTQRLSRNLYKVVPKGEIVMYAQRIAEAGTWISTLFWMPAKLAVSSRNIDRAVNLTGWLLLVPLFACLIRDVKQRQWIWVGVLLLCGTIVLRWSSANERYLIPVAPLLLLGPWLGMELLAKRIRRPGRWQRLAKALVLGPIVSVAVCNAALLTIDISIARSDDFYAHHHAGRTQMLVASAHYLTSERDLKDGELAVSPLYININRPVQNSFGVRVMNVLTDRMIRTVPREVCEGEPDDRLIRWAARRGVRYYLYRPPVVPWRVWHFRCKWLQERITGEAVTVSNPSWELYEFKDGTAIKLAPPTVQNWPRVLPGVRPHAS